LEASALFVGEYLTPRVMAWYGLFSGDVVHVEVVAGVQITEKDTTSKGAEELND